MTVDRIELGIGKLLVTTLAAQGFELNRKWGSFVRKQPYGFDAMVIVNQGTSSGEYFKIAVHGHIHHDRIEVPWNTLGFVHGEENQRQTWTLMWTRRRNAPLWKVFPATMQADMTVVAREIEVVLSEELLPFFKRYANLDEIEKLANVRPLVEYEQYSVGGPLDHRAMRSLLLAKAANPGRYASVREAFVTSELKTLFPRAKCMELLARVDEMRI